MAQSDLPPTHPAPGAALPPPASDLNVRRLVITTLAVLLASAVAFTAMTWLVNLYTELTPNFTMPRNIQNLNAKVTPEDLDNRNQFIESSRESLSTYGWLNREQGTVRIPIERAIELTVQRGLPARTNPPTTTRQNVPGQFQSGDENSGRRIGALQR
ncbi:MAG TPA: hypothetical protein VHL09_12280 [Dehalococcoidia bacterium]|nr:hypothetical protein [Dehalococcoidia bacterium]